MEPILLWDFLKWGTTRLAGKTIGGLVLPAQNIKFSYAKITNPKTLNSSTLIHDKPDVLTPDGANLDTLEISHVDQLKVEFKFQKYIINFVGNAGAYEQNISEMRGDASALKCNVVGFNFRGVSHSTGRAQSKDDLVTDGIAQVQRLLDKGVSPQNIYLKGFSIGAGVASLVAQHFHDLKQPINLFNNRSFSSITNVLVGHIRLMGGKTGHIETLGGKILGWIAKPFIKLVVTLASWEINAGDAFQRIPHEYKDYMVLRTRKKNRDKSIVDDRTIPHYASIHAYLKEERRAKKAEIATKADPLKNENVLNGARDLKAVRKQFNQRKMKAYRGAKNGHNASMEELYNGSFFSANALFTQFIQRSSNDHAMKQTVNPLPL